MRIVQLIDSLEPGGAERMAVNLANVLADKIHFSGIITTRKEGALIETISSKVSYHFLRKNKTLDLPAIIRLRKFVKRNKIQFIHAHSSSFFLASLLKISYPKIKIIWHDHYGNSEFLNKRPMFVLKIMSLFFSKIIVVNENLKVWAKENLYCKEVLFLPNFPELSKITSKETILKGNDGKRIICLANLRPQKNHFLVIEIAKKMKEKHVDWSFHLVGKDFNDAYSDALKEAIIQNNLENTVFLYDSCNDVAAILSDVNIALITSLSEGLPVSLLEYGTFGLPVISSKVGDIENVIKDSVSGILIPNFEAIAFYEALLRLIHDTNLKKQIGDNLKELITQNYTAESVSKKYIEFINA
ncbi:glycosyltransferase [Flavobacterium sp. J27]|uniref:glycosyltransferase n=1 Tax=Flavobacterium sp. J27 TaxID=2060419 RepID=UPI00102FEE70|nr:glycosyltransferase [Flavobacterium sp. J27]